MKEKKVIVIGGPTASGKTAISIELAKRLNCSIISADSRQFYREMSIGTAKPSQAEMQGITHYFIDCQSIETELNAGQYAEAARACITKLFETNDHVIVVGGSGLFIKALLEGLDELPGNKEIREKWNAFHSKNGLSLLQEQLLKADPDYYNSVDLQNPVRLIRALEVFEITGTPFSQLRSGSAEGLPYPYHYFVVNHDRDVLYNRINQRVDDMMENGLLAEVESLKNYREKQSLNTVGYKEIFNFFEGLHTLDEAVELIKQNSRRYAKRQITWFKGIDNATWITNKSTLEAVAAITSHPFVASIL
jgi:tRNA dimethylallyltransferase